MREEDEDEGREEEGRNNWCYDYYLGVQVAAYTALGSFSIQRCERVCNSKVKGHKVDPAEKALPFYERTFIKLP